MPTGRPVLLDPFTGAHFALSVQRMQDGYTFIEFDARFAGLMLVLFDSGAETLEALYSRPYRDIDFAGAWQCELAPTLDNRYGDYRLPAFDSYIGAEARSLSTGLTAAIGRRPHTHMAPACCCIGVNSMRAHWLILSRRATYLSRTASQCAWA